MKNLILFIVPLLFIVEGSAQEEIVPLNNDYLYGIPNGVYVKDINNDFYPYVGTWTAVLDDKQYFIRFVLIPHHLISFPNGNSYHKDILVGSYKVTDLSGNVLQGDLNNINPQETKIQSISYPVNNQLSFMYIDDDLCGYTGKIMTKLNFGSPNTLSYTFTAKSFVPDEGCYAEENPALPIPAVSIILTKVE